jgi:ABC-type transporter Mla maintaining outer membrane lipid asymmetry ATPase subunit MlaF
MSVTPVVRAEKVHKSYGHTPVLTGIDLEVARATSAA